MDTEDEYVYAQLITGRGALQESFPNSAHLLLERGPLQSTPGLFEFNLQSAAASPDCTGGLTASASFLALLLAVFTISATCIWITMAIIQIRWTNCLRAQAVQDAEAKRAEFLLTVPVVVIQPDEIMHLGYKLSPTEGKDKRPPAWKLPAVPAPTKGCSSDPPTACCREHCLQSIYSSIRGGSVSAAAAAFQQV